MSQNTLLTYDVSAKHIDVKSRLKAAGFMDHWTSEGTKYYLPNTTLWSNRHTPAQAKEEIEKITRDLGVKLERDMAVLFSDWKGIPGEPHRS